MMMMGLPHTALYLPHHHHHHHTHAHGHHHHHHHGNHHHHHHHGHHHHHYHGLLCYGPSPNSPVPFRSRVSIPLPVSFRRRVSVSPRASLAIVAPDSTHTLFCILAGAAAFGQVVEAKTKWGSKLSAPLVTLLIGMSLASGGIIPSTSPSYDFVCRSLMPMAVALCLLETDIGSIFVDAGLTLKAFWYGALGTIIGTLVSFKIVGPAMGKDGWKIASSLCASYIGGTINYAATSQALGLSSTNIAAGMAADNLAMAAYFAVIMFIPDKLEKSTSETDGDASLNSMPPTVETISTSLAAAAAACTIGNAAAKLLPASFAGSGLAISALITSCFSAIATRLHPGTQTPNVKVFAGSQIIGSSLMLLYFSVVGASAGFKDAFIGGWPLLAFILILISVHFGVILYLGSRLKLPMRMVLVASNANIGGPATAAAMANCRGWQELVKPAVLVGTLGYAIGTGIGCLLGVHALRWML